MAHEKFITGGDTLTSTMLAIYEYYRLRQEEGFVRKMLIFAKYKKAFTFFTIPKEHIEFLNVHEKPMDLLMKQITPLRELAEHLHFLTMICKEECSPLLAYQKPQYEWKSLSSEEGSFGDVEHVSCVEVKRSYWNTHILEEDYVAKEAK